MILEFKNKLNSDFSNFDEVYQQMLLEYRPDNIDRTEVMFINSFNSGNKNDEIWNKIQSKDVQWQLLDYYNHFLKTKRFLFRGIARKPFRKQEFKNIQTELNYYILKYHYIFCKLSEEEKKEFKPDVIDHLNNLLKFQECTKYKTLFSDTIKQIENDFYNNPQQNVSSKIDEIYKTKNLFKVGLLFAKGEMNKYFTLNSKNSIVIKKEYSAPKIAKELGNIKYNKYILASINNYTDKENGSKNIFNSFDMMTKIISHCNTESITVDSYFKSRLPIK